MARPKLNRKLLRLVGDELARGAPVSTFEERLARKFRITTRAVRKYAALMNERRDREDAADLKRARRQGRFVAMAAGARWQARAEKLYDAAWRLVARAVRIDGKAGAASRLIKAIEAEIPKPRRPLDDDPDPTFDQDDGADEALIEIATELKRTPVILQIARDDRRDAALLLKRAEQADARAAVWFEQAQKISGTYEPETYDPSKHGGAAANLTSAQKRARLMKVLEAAKAIAAKGKPVAQDDA